MSNEEPVYVERTVTPAGTTREVREVHSNNAAGWWVAAIVAVVAIVGLLWAFGAQRQTSDAEQLAAARDAGRAEAMIDNASAQAQSAAVAATEASRQASQNLAAATERAAASAEAASRDAAERTQDAAADATNAAQNAVGAEPQDQPAQ